MVISPEIRPLAVLYPPPNEKYMLYTAVCSCLRQLRPFLLYQSKDIFMVRGGGGCNVARSLISCKIAKTTSSCFIFSISFADGLWLLFCVASHKVITLPTIATAIVVSLL